MVYTEQQLKDLEDAVYSMRYSLSLRYKRIFKDAIEELSKQVLHPNIISFTQHPIDGISTQQKEE